MNISEFSEIANHKMSIRLTATDPESFSDAAREPESILTAAVPEPGTSNASQGRFRKGCRIQCRNEV